MATHWECSLSLSFSLCVQHLNKILAIFRSTCELHWLHGSEPNRQNKNTAHGEHERGHLHVPATRFSSVLLHIFQFYFHVGKEGHVLACPRGGQWCVLPHNFCLIPLQGYRAPLCRVLFRITVMAQAAAWTWRILFSRPLDKIWTEYESSKGSVAEIHK